MAAELARVLRKQGFSVDWNYSKRSLAAVSKKRNARKTILLVSHFDTVLGRDKKQHPAIVSSTADAPYQPYVRGPGAADNKGGIVMIEKLLEVFRGSSLNEQIEWKIFLAADEEIGSRISNEHLREFASGADFALVFEPGWYDSELQSIFIPVRSGGNLHISFRVTGEEMHPAISNLQGRNTNDLAADLISEISKLRVPGRSVNVYYMKGLSKKNVTTPLTEFEIAIRYSQIEEKKEIAIRLAEIAARYSAYPFEVTFEIQSKWDPQWISSKKAVAILNRAAANTGQSLIPSVALARGAGGILGPLGIPTLDSMGPYGAGFHGPNETLFAGSFYERLQLLREIVLELIKD